MTLTFTAARNALRGGGLKVSQDAVLQFIHEYQEWAKKITIEASEIAKSNHRYTVLERDIELAVTRVAKRESI